MIVMVKVHSFKVQNELAVQDEANFRWPNGVVTYFVDYESYDRSIDTDIFWATDLIERSSCIQFKKSEEKVEGNNTWIHITNPNKERDCMHVPRYKESGEIELVLGYDCLKPKEILHTLLHGIGIKDEVTHPHRDKYIRVLWNNINPAYHNLYQKQALKPSSVVIEYDPLSVMQFHDRAYSRNGQATIAPVEPGLLISPSETLSQLDKMRLQIYFGRECNRRKVSNLLHSCKISFKKQEVGGSDSEHNDYEKREENSRESLEHSGENDHIESDNEHKLKHPSGNGELLASSAETDIENNNKEDISEETKKLLQDKSSNEKSSEQIGNKNSTSEDRVPNSHSGGDNDNQEKSHEEDFNKLGSVKKQLKDSDYEIKDEENEVNFNKTIV